MKLTRIVAVGVLAGMGPIAAAALPLDRPSPPPCCADGVCYVHAAGFGYNPTRWRVWPGLAQAPMPTIEQPPIRQIPGISPIETPTPEEEDRMAPPPIRSLAPPSPAAEGTSPVSPTAPPPQTLPFDSQNGLRGGAVPAAPVSPFAPRPGTPGGATQPNPTQPLFPFGNEPEGEISTPSTLPFGPSASLDRPPAGESVANGALATRTSTRPVASNATARSATQARYAGDPPPTPPFAIGNADF